ncbi:cytochrome c oxidase subunit 4, mitochondrial [Aspergillus udagawae]|uniref:Cytochrome c oxidase subunit 4, mitochondrial n=1 Tax=Aspergillus udagawae TaxID=91492 RepID=A0ABQ1B7K4_9EURO|nr:cytochrome c oxidase subunit 4, mitochondrial [Aspergillus udagawae]GFF95429.1 cytochrome c oxidase subunit 4, mitochondrial [Aspergillus udagawae]GFG12085.1 cytochrome c oxidase subunit 4, mitochondrial [Aspergillus udagawae]GFG27320.1 cytochrome c oxidase subunit 4, mitochondrial [Aspergillus udagawae]
MSVTLADPYRDYALDYAQHAKPEGHENALAYQTQHSHLQRHKEANPPFPQGTPSSTAYEQHHASTTVLSAANPNISQSVVLTPAHMLPRQLPMQYTPATFEIPPVQRGKKRPHSEAEGEGDYGDHGVRPRLSALSTQASTETAQSPGMLFSVQGDSSQQQAHHQQQQQPQQQQQNQHHHHHHHHQPMSSHGFGPPESMALPQQHHHHRLPPQASLHSAERHGMNVETSPIPSGPPSVVGQPGMPDPAPRPRGPKLKFTQEEDALLVELKENKNLTWKQIADFFPGRTSGTLQVRYCTKLKAKDVTWTDEMVQRLQRAIQEYENDRWRIIAGKVGNGFTPAACREKASQL